MLSLHQPAVLRAGAPDSPGPIRNAMTSRAIEIRWFRQRLGLTKAKFAQLIANGGVDQRGVAQTDPKNRYVRLFLESEPYPIVVNVHVQAKPGCGVLHLFWLGADGQHQRKHDRKR